jgi:hypothetical protein
LPDTADQALSILPPEFPPTFVILTGNGLQVWWLFREPYVFESDEDRRAATACDGGAIIDHEAPRERRFVAVEK